MEAEEFYFIHNRRGKLRNFSRFHSKYDPKAIEEINQNIQNIGKFSLLRFIVWARHQLPEIIKKFMFIKDRLTSNPELIKERKEKIDKIDEVVMTLEDILYFSNRKNDENDENGNKYIYYEQLLKEKIKERRDLVRPFLIKHEFEYDCRICIFFSKLLTFIFIFCLVILPSIMIFITIVGISSLSLVIKVSQVSFVSDLEILEWKYENFIQFIAFLNNILSLDTGKIKSFNSIMTFMFSGEDAEESEEEKRSRKTFMDSLISFSVINQGLLKTLIILPQIGTSELQKIFIHDRTTKIKKEEERVRHRQMMSDYLIKEIKEIKDDEEKGKVKDESLKGDDEEKDKVKELSLIHI